MEPIDLDARLESALHSASPRFALQKLMTDLLENGREGPEILPALEVFRAKLAAQSRQADDELIFELMDGFNGWCRI